MTNLSAEKIAEYYHQYRYQEIRFDEKAIDASGLIQRELYLQCGESRWSCKIRTASLTGAKVEVKLTQEEIQSILAAGDVSVNYSFAGLKAMPIPMSYTVDFVISDESSIVRLKTDAWVLSLSTTKQPPDYVIEVFGDLLRFRATSKGRQEERIEINANSAAQLGLKSMTTNITLDGVMNECVLRDLSFSGAAVLLSSGEKKKPAKGILQLLFLKPDTIFELTGTVMRYQLEKGSSGSYFAGLRFEEAVIPLDYKMRINALLEKS